MMYLANIQFLTRIDTALADVISKNLAHIHLLLNHFPTIGFGIGLGLFLVGLFGKNTELKRASLVILFLIAVIAIPTYVSGAAALDKLCERCQRRYYMSGRCFAGPHSVS